MAGLSFPDSRRSDEELACKGQGGDEQALAQLLHRFRNRIYRYAQARGASDIETEQVTAEALEVMIRDLGRYRGRSRFATWVIGIARNRLAQVRRDQSRIPAALPLDECYDIAGRAGLEPDVRFHRAAQVRLVHDLLDRLTPLQREIVTLVWLEGRTATETARLLGRTRPAVSMCLHRALRRLSGIVAERRPKSDDESSAETPGHEAEQRPGSERTAEDTESTVYNDITEEVIATNACEEGDAW